MARDIKRPPEVAFYRELGRSLRAARLASGRNQSDIARHLAVSFQSVQKYEKGTNRISLYRLVSLADCIEAPLSEFVAPSASDSEFQSLTTKFKDKEFHALVEAWGTIRNRVVRAALLTLVQSMAESGCD
jgi:transcriptional regulator with XRE-family HTH domain